MSFTTYQQVLDAMPGQLRALHRAPSVGAAGAYTSFNNTAAPANPGAIPASDWLLVPGIRTPAAGKTLYLARSIIHEAGQVSPMLLFDRLYHAGGLVANVATAQNVNPSASVALTRNTGGVGNEIWVEVTTATGATATTVTCSYTNQAGTAGRISPAVPWPASASLARMLRLPLLPPDTGVRSVQTITLAATTGTAGAFNVLIIKPIALLSGLAATSVQREIVSMLLPPIETGVSLGLAQIQSSTSGHYIATRFNIVEG